MQRRSSKDPSESAEWTLLDGVESDRWDSSKEAWVGWNIFRAAGFIKRGFTALLSTPEEDGFVSLF